MNMKHNHACPKCGQDLRLGPNAMKEYRKMERTLRCMAEATLAPADKLRKSASDAIQFVKRSKKRSQ